MGKTISGKFLLTPLREGRRARSIRARPAKNYFYSRPCGRGDAICGSCQPLQFIISTHAPAGGATITSCMRPWRNPYFYSRPCGRGDRTAPSLCRRPRLYFNSRPCGRGDQPPVCMVSARADNFYSRPCGRGDAGERAEYPVPLHFYSRPCGRGDGRRSARCSLRRNFYSRPCGRGDWSGSWDSQSGGQFLLTPLREGRQMLATPCARDYRFLLTPLREGRHKLPVPLLRSAFDFYSRPCGRGDHLLADQRFTEALISTHAPAGGATVDGALDRKNLPNFYSRPCGRGDGYAGLYQVLHADDFYSRPCGRGDGLHACEQPIDVLISTHAPAGGATSSSLSSRHSRSVTAAACSTVRMDTGHSAISRSAAWSLSLYACMIAPHASLSSPVQSSITEPAAVLSVVATSVNV